MIKNCESCSKPIPRKAKRFCSLACYWNTGPSQEQRESERQTMLRRWRNPEFRERMVKSLTGRKITLTPAKKRQLQERARKGGRSLKRQRGRASQTREIIAQKIKKLWQSEQYREKQADSQKGKHSESMKRIWQTECPQRDNIITGQNRKPNKAEKRLDRILQEYFPGQYKYVGDGSLIIEGKNPDFVNVNGQKKIIELFGEFWHQDLFEAAERINLFRNYGYETLIIWSKELESKILAKKIRRFNDGQS